MIINLYVLINLMDLFLHSKNLMITSILYLYKDNAFNYKKKKVNSYALVILNDYNNLSTQNF